ncbi:hypothetical protein LEMLEM_LOCUS12837 [Lemmus lemmus]
MLFSQTFQKRAWDPLEVESQTVVSFLAREFWKPNWSSAENITEKHKQRKCIAQVAMCGPSPRGYVYSTAPVSKAERQQWERRWEESRAASARLYPRTLTDSAA